MSVLPRVCAAIGKLGCASGGALCRCHGSALLGGIEPVTRPWTDAKQPPFEIRWNRVYALPDFVRFVHKPHIWAGVQCQECHGPVETMDRVVPVHEINMGFCVDCHTKRGATQECFVCHH